MQKVDFKKEFKRLYRPSAKKIAIVDVQPLQFLMIDGHGDPNASQAYQEALETLYAVSYTLKFASKKALEQDYTVMPLEGLWWVEDMAGFNMDYKEAWDWTAMIMQPHWISAEMVGAAREVAARKKDWTALPKLRFETYHEGLAVQIMHIGSYADEGTTIARLHAFIEENGYQLAGKHHEVYLGDPRRTAPDKLKTVIRQPMVKVD